MTADPDAALREAQARIDMYGDLERRHPLSARVWEALEIAGVEPTAERVRDVTNYLFSFGATLAATASPGLDVERLANAMRAEDISYSAAWRAGEKNWTWEKRAAAIAREYAALAADRETPND